MTIEQQTANTILQAPLGTVKVGMKEYPIPRPTVGTLIMISEIVSLLPQPKPANNNTFLADILSTASGMRPIGRIVAVLLMGAERVLTEEAKVRSYSRWKFWKRKEKNAVDKLSDDVINTLSPSEINTIIGKVIDTMQLGHFFGLSTSLKTQNILAPTRNEVETGKTTVSGH